MKAIGIKTSLPIKDSDSLIQFETDMPEAKGRDLLVRIEAVSVNPVDFKRRQLVAKDTILDLPAILGWDAVGRVEQIGEDVSLFKVGDRVFYAGDITRAGCNAEYQLVDERIVGLCPSKLSVEESAAMPLTSLTAWEVIFDRIRIIPDKDKGKTILIIAGAGGVGSVAIQIAKHIVGLTVIATASRPESIKWCKDMGADYVVDHRDLVNAVRSTGHKEVDYILDFVDVNSYWNAMVELIKPQGHIASITGSSEPVALNLLKTKSATFSWELMFTRPMFHTEDMLEQHNILNKVSGLLDQGILKSTLSMTLNSFKVDNFKKAHELLESGKMIGKLVIKY